MKTNLFRLFLILIFCSCQKKTEEYVCKPCDLPCDSLVFTKPGICPHCNMKLLKKTDVIKESALVLNEVNIETGSGVFLIDGGMGNKEKIIRIYYHQPNNYSADSKILIVVPGAGRNGDSYRDAWVEASEKYGVLILSPMYPEEEYPFEAYHMGGVIKNLNLNEAVEFIDNSNVAQLDEDALDFDINTNSQDWIFNDFDRLFNLVKDATKSSQTQYDIFGHSAGGQILHRFAIFQPNSKTNRILASNSGFYTLPDFQQELPFGLKNTTIPKEGLKNSFNKKLILFIGELDNQNETGGTLLRSSSSDKQGLHRLERAKYFYDFTKQKAKELELDYKWEIEIIPNVGHNHRGMGRAAADFLYQEEEK